MLSTQLKFRLAQQSIKVLLEIKEESLLEGKMLIKFLYLNHGKFQGFKSSENLFL